MVSFILNGACKELAVAAETPLLWAVREHLQLTGTKFGCGVASCGACTVHVDGAPVRSCVTTLAMVEGRSVVAIPHFGAVHESGRGPTRKSRDVRFRAAVRGIADIKRALSCSAVDAPQPVSHFVSKHLPPVIRF